MKDPALKHALAFGVGIVTETMTEAERGVVDLLFESGAVQVWGCGRGGEPDGGWMVVGWGGGGGG